MLPITLLTLALFDLAIAQNATSNSTTPECLAENGVGTYDSFNITTTTNMPGFQFPNTSPSNWTLHWGVKDTRNATDQSSTTNMYMWLDSTDKDTDLDSPELLYTGCIVGLSLTNPKKSTGDIGVGDGCAGVFSEKCYNAIVKSVALSAQQPLRGTDVEKRCIRMADWDNEACKEDDAVWGAKHAAVLFGNGTAGTNGSDGCGDAGVTGDAQLRTSAWLNVRTQPNNYNNHTGYDSIVANASPFLLIGIAKNDSDTIQHGDQGPNWGDARLVCVTPGGITSAATRGMVSMGGLYAVVAMGIAFVLSDLH